MYWCPLQDLWLWETAGWAEAATFYGTSSPSIIPQPQFQKISLRGPGPLISPFSWAPWVVRSTGRLKSKHPEMSSIKIFFAISLNLQSAYFPLVFILGKHNTFSYSRLQQPPEPKDGFFPPGTHASNSLPEILFNLLYSGNQVSIFRIKFSSDSQSHQW